MNELVPFGKLIMIIGVILLIIGLLLIYGPKIPLIGRLPGDIHIQKDNFSFYFPLTTCIILSLILTLIFYLIQKFK